MTENIGAQNIGALAEALSDILAAENAALAALDMKAATALLPAKHAATAALAAAQRLSLPAPPHAAATRLRSLALENKRLLERAMTVQDRLLACIARAMPRALPQGGGYGARGGPKSPHLLPPVALSARA